MPDLPGLEADAAARHLAVLGLVPGGSDPDMPPGTLTLALLGPAPGFWTAVSGEPEFADGLPDPLDRWSRRVIGRWACDLGAKAVFPFGGPPYRPFLRWAVDSGQAWPSPVGPLVHDRHGLMVSYRGALALKDALPRPPTGPRPCETCAKPCLTTCPVAAMGAHPYGVPACKAHLRTDAGRDCRDGGCLVRRACPLGPAAGRDPAQSAFHMSSFLASP